MLACACCVFAIGYHQGHGKTAHRLERVCGKDVEEKSKTEEEKHRDGTRLEEEK